MAAQWAARFDARQWPLTWPVWLHSGTARFDATQWPLTWPVWLHSGAASFDARQWPLTWPVWLHSGRRGLMLGSLHGPYGCTVGGEV